jgi:hypothetical protein
MTLNHGQALLKRTAREERHHDGRRWTLTELRLNHPAPPVFVVRSVNRNC